MDLFAAAVLGVVQGFTEFLPISSSAHLILIPWLSGWQPSGIEFDVSLHVGTALAVICFFWRDWVTLVREAILGLATRQPFATAERRLAWYIVIGTVPAAVFGLAFEKSIEEKLRSPLITVVTLTALGVVLYAADRYSNRRRSLADFSLADALWIGTSQAVALIPGVSRSGITISAAMFRNSDRASAARFSFLLATPVIVGGGLLEGRRLLEAAGMASAGVAGPASINWAAFAVGALCATVTGLICIRFFLRYLQTRSFLPFVIYRFALAGIVLAFYLRHF